MSGRSHYSAVEPARSVYAASVPPQGPGYRRPSDAPRSEYLAPSAPMSQRSHRRSSSAIDDRMTVVSAPPGRPYRGSSVSEVRAGDARSSRSSRSNHVGSVYGDHDRDRDGRSVRGGNDTFDTSTRGAAAGLAGAVVGGLLGHEAADAYRGNRSRRESSSQSAVGYGERERSDRERRNDYSHSVAESRRYSSDSSGDENRSGSGKKRMLAALAGAVAVGLGANAVNNKINEEARKRDSRLEMEARERERERERIRAQRDHDARSHYSSPSYHSHHSNPSSSTRPVMGSRVGSDYSDSSERGRHREQELLSRDRSRARDYQKEVSRDRASYYDARTSDDRLYPVNDDFVDPYAGRNF